MFYRIENHSYYFVPIINCYSRSVDEISEAYNIDKKLVWDKLEEYHGYIDKKLFTIGFYSKDGAFKFVEFLQTLEVANQLSK